MDGQRLEKKTTGLEDKMEKMTEELGKKMIGLLAG